VRKCIAFAVALAVLAVPAFGWELAIGDQFEWDFSIDIGQLYFDADLTEIYHEEDLILDVYDYDEDYDSFFTRANFRAGNYDYEGLEAGLNFSIFGTENQDDSFSETYIPYANGVPFEPGIMHDSWDYSMDVHGFEILPEVGAAGQIADDLAWAAFFGYGYRRTEMERTGGYFDSEYDVHWLNFKGRILWDVPGMEGLSLLVEPAVGPVIASKRTDDFAGNDYTMRGDGGVMFGIRGQAKCDVTENIRVLLGVFYDLQWLDGGSHTDEDLIPVDLTLEWDDSLVQTVGGTLGVEFLF